MCNIVHMHLLTINIWHVPLTCFHLSNNINVNMYYFLSERLEIIVQHSSSCDELFKRKKVTKEVLASYLAANGVTNLGTKTRPQLGQEVMDLWKEKKEVFISLSLSLSKTLINILF